MVDINKYIRNTDGREDPRQRDHALEITDWNEDQARATAQDLNIELTDEHWAVINFLRENHIQNGRAESGRDLADVLASKFETDGGKKHLYRLFPEGPVAQGCRIAGVPLPPYTEDKGFGSAI